MCYKSAISAEYAYSRNTAAEQSTTVPTLEEQSSIPVPGGEKGPTPSRGVLWMRDEKMEHLKKDVIYDDATAVIGMPLSTCRRTKKISACHTRQLSVLFF